MAYGLTDTKLYACRVKTCTLNGCDLPWHCGDYCAAHYARWKRNGTPGGPEVWTKKRPPCKVDGCPRPHNGHGYCTTHGRRLVKGGSTGYVPSRAREDNPAWTGAAASYNAVHERLRNWQGPARERLCRCGKQARHWAYQHSDPNPSFTRTGLPYSTILTHYAPMCVPCHKRMDLDRRAARQAQLSVAGQ